MALEPRTEKMFKRLYEKAKNFNHKERAFFDSEMDQLIYIRSDEPYRAERVDAYLTLLWHAYHRELIGVKIKGFRSIFDQAKKQGLVQESHFIPLCATIGMLLREKVSPCAPSSGEAAFVYKEKMYRQAEEVVGTYRIDQRMMAA